MKARQGSTAGSRDPMEGRQHAFNGMKGNGGTTEMSLPWIPPTSSGKESGIMRSTDPMNWAFPISRRQSEQRLFSYPSSPAAVPGSDGSTETPSAHIPHLKQTPDIQNPSVGDVTVNNLGFATLDDWFGQTGLEQGTEESDAVFGGFDLQDFWMKVGPGEVG